MLTSYKGVLCTRAVQVLVGKLRAQQAFMTTVFRSKQLVNTSLFFVFDREYSSKGAIVDVKMIDIGHMKPLPIQ